MTKEKTLKEYLKENRWTAVELSKKTGISLRMIHYIIDGEKKISADNLPKIAKVLGISETELKKLAK